jgi:Polymorphic toxin system, DSP-PTPase phosphatase
MTSATLSFEDQVIMTAYPIFKGEIEGEYGSLLFGRLWHQWELPFFTGECESQGIDIIWNLLETSHGNIGPATELHSPIEDFGAPANADEFYRDADVILAALKAGKKIFVHCHSGKGRTALALATLLIKLGWENQTALSFVHEKTLGPETDIQREFVLNICA